MTCNPATYVIDYVNQTGVETIRRVDVSVPGPVALLLDKNRNNKLCTTRLSRYSPSELFTVSQADALIEEMVQDSLFYM